MRAGADLVLGILRRSLVELDRGGLGRDREGGR